MCFVIDGDKPINTISQTDGQKSNDNDNPRQFTVKKWVTKPDMND